MVTTNIFIPSQEEKTIAEDIGVRLLEKLSEEVLEVELQHYILKVMLGAFENKHNIIESEVLERKQMKGKLSVKD